MAEALTATVLKNEVLRAGVSVTSVDATVHVRARDNVVNGIRVGVDPRNGHLIVEDDAGIAAGRGCMPMSGTDGTAVDCGPATGTGGVTRLNVSMGNFGDSFFSTAPSTPPSTPGPAATSCGPAPVTTRSTCATACAATAR